MEKDYRVKNVKKSKEVNRELNVKIAANLAFVIGGFVLGGIAFGMGDDAFNSSAAELAAKGASIGLTSSSINALWNLIKTKKEYNATQKETRTKK